MAPAMRGLTRQSPAGMSCSIPDPLHEVFAATRQGLILGTAGYMAPEQARGEPLAFSAATSQASRSNLAS